MKQKIDLSSTKRKLKGEKTADHVFFLASHQTWVVNGLGIFCTVSLFHGKCSQNPMAKHLLKIL